MKKSKLISLLLAVAMVMSMIVLPVGAEGEDDQVSALTAASCEHTDAGWTEIAEGTWTGGALEGGHYKLIGNQTITSALTVAAGQTICIDLNGCNITGPKKDNVRVFEIAAGGTLNIMDFVGTGVVSGGRVKNTQTGSPISEVFGGNIYNAGTFTLYGGTISGGYAWTTANYYPHISGGNIYGAAGSVTNIKGGTVKDGKVYKSGSYSAANGLGGGNIFSEGTVNISGGLITGGVMDKQGSITHANPRANYIYGGNIRMRKGTLNISGGTISDGKLTGIAKNGNGKSSGTIYGGNIYTDGTAVTISGGTISGGEIDVEVNSAKGVADAACAGGNICISGGSATITGGIITGGTINCNASRGDTTTASMEVTAYGGNLAVLSAKLEMSGATISDGVITGYVTNPNGANAGYGRGGNIYISGKTATITDSTISGGKVEVEFNSASGKVSTYASGGNICFSDVTATMSEVTISGGTVSGAATKAEGNSSTSEYDVEGGNVNVMNTAVVNMTSGLITQGKTLRHANGGVTAYGGNVSVAGEGTQFNVSGGTLSEGYALYRGGNLAVRSDSDVTLSGTAILRDSVAEPATSGSRGYEIVVLSGGGLLTINDNAQVLNKEAAEKPNLSVLYIITNADVVINGGKVEGMTSLSGTDSNPYATLTLNGGEIGVFERSSVVAKTNLVIGNGVTTHSSPLNHQTGEATVRDLETNAYTTYETASEALEASKEGNVIYLAKDATVDGEISFTGTLDLNGRNLTTTDRVDASFNDSFIKDSQGTGSVDAAKGFYVNAQNPQLPVTVGTRTTFEKKENITFTQKLEVKTDANGDTYHKFSFYIATPSTDTMVDNAIISEKGMEEGRSLRVRITVGYLDGEGNEKTYSYTYTPELTDKYAEAFDSKVFVCDITGLSDTCTVTADLVTNEVCVAGQPIAVADLAG